MKKTLVILAAGIGSRYGGGIKQIEPVGANGEIIIDYSIHDAIAAGFNKIVVIIRKDIEADFNDVIGYRLKDVCKMLDVELVYVFQEHPLTDPSSYPEGRKKPWGTAHALLCCEDVIDEPFAVINADDYYGKKGFRYAAEILEEGCYGMIGYRLGNTLSDNGAVTRGICTVSDGMLSEITETHGIVKSELGAVSGGRTIPLDTDVSMNFWCFPASFIGKLRDRFPSFLDKLNDPLKDEFLLPVVIGKYVEEGGEVKVVETDDKWFGVTYHEDKEFVVEEFRKLYQNGDYEKDLYSDLMGTV